MFIFSFVCRRRYRCSGPLVPWFQIARLPNYPITQSRPGVAPYGALLHLHVYPDLTVGARLFRAFGAFWAIAMARSSGTRFLGPRGSDKAIGAEHS
jgi:hypothetical protein